MGRKRLITGAVCLRLRTTQSAKLVFSRNKGQALVEFTLCFILLLVIAWIPADFGLLFYTHQLAQNAAREGVRVAAADPTLATGTQSCTMPCGSGSEILQQISKRVANGLMSNVNTTITLSTPSGAVSTCATNPLIVRVEIQEEYDPFFYKILRMLRANVPNAIMLNPRADMRWEHQC
jgi:type IV secretory pathway TrbD component